MLNCEILQVTPDECDIKLLLRSRRECLLLEKQVSQETVADVSYGALEWLYIWIGFQFGVYRVTNPLIDVVSIKLLWDPYADITYCKR